MASIKIRSPAEISKEFNQTVKDLLVRLEKKSRSDEEVANLDRLEQRIKLLKRTLGEMALIGESCQFFIEYAEKIMGRDETFFLELDVRGEYLKKHAAVAKQDEFIFSLVDSIKNYYRGAGKREKDEIYSEVKTLSDCSIEYTLAMRGVGAAK